MPEHFSDGLNPVALGFMVCMGILMLVLSRRYALIPLYAAACYMTLGQVVKVGELNFTIIRILALIGWLRMLVRGEFRAIRMHPIDKAMLWWTLSSVVIYTMLWQTKDAFIYKCGSTYDAVGLYVLFRGLVRNVPEIIKIFKIMSLLIVPLAAFMMVEKFTGRNAFAVFGGVPGVTIVRDGVLRCQGPFPQSILAGTFGATLVPLFLALWQQKRGRMLAIIGLISSAAITFASGSSGPILTYACGVLGFSLWKWRFQMQIVRRAIVFCLLGLQLIMTEPVWFVIAHMGIFSGSTSYYRAYLIDRTIAHFFEWWLIGTRYEHAWGPLLTDITNYYVRLAMDGGLLTLVLFFVILKRSFGGVGNAMRAKVHRPIGSQYCIWALGAALFAHVSTFLAVWYWDQNIVNWYLLLAMIAIVSGPAYGVRKQTQELSVEIEIKAAAKPEQARLSLSSSLP